MGANPAFFLLETEQQLAKRVRGLGACGAAHQPTAREDGLFYSFFREPAELAEQRNMRWRETLASAGTSGHVRSA